MEQLIHISIFPSSRIIEREWIKKTARARVGRCLQKKHSFEDTSRMVIDGSCVSVYKLKTDAISAWEIDVSIKSIPN